MYHRYIGYDITSQARKVSGRAFVLGVPTFPLSRIFLFDFGIVPTVWDFVLFSVLSPRYSGACFNEHIDLWSQLKDNGYVRAYQRFPFRQVMIALVIQLITYRGVHEQHTCCRNQIILKAVGSLISP
jgi:hypothetical protein